MEPLSADSQAVVLDPRQVAALAYTEPLGRLRGTPAHRLWLFPWQVDPVFREGPRAPPAGSGCSLRRRGGPPARASPRSRTGMSCAGPSSTRPHPPGRLRVRRRVRPRPRAGTTRRNRGSSSLCRPTACTASRRGGSRSRTMRRNRSIRAHSGCCAAAPRSPWWCAAAATGPSTAATSCCSTGATGARSPPVGSGTTRASTAGRRRTGSPGAAPPAGATRSGTPPRTAATRRGSGTCTRRTTRSTAASTSSGSPPTCRWTAGSGSRPRTR